MRKSSTYARKRARQSAFDRQRHKDINPVKEAVIRSEIEAQITSLRTNVGLQAYIGEDAGRIANAAGRLFCIVLYAASVQGMDGAPETRIVAGAASATFHIANAPAELERQRGAVIAGLQAVERLIPHLNTLTLALGAQELDRMQRATQGMRTEDVRQAMGIGMS